MPTVNVPLLAPDIVSSDVLLFFKSIKFPANPDALLTPIPVPDVLHAVEVVPVGSIKK